MSKHEIPALLEYNAEDMRDDARVVVSYDDVTAAVVVMLAEDRTIGLGPEMYAKDFPVLYLDAPSTADQVDLWDDARVALGEVGWEVL